MSSASASLSRSVVERSPNAYIPSKGKVRLAKSLVGPGLGIKSGRGSMSGRSIMSGGGIMSGSPATPNLSRRRKPQWVSNQLVEDKHESGSVEE